MTILDSIIEGVREDTNSRSQRTPLAALRDAAEQQTPALKVCGQLRRDPGSGVKVIAEVKRQSPSKGNLADIPDPAALATAYQDGGAAMVSVLTEERRFGGSLADLDTVRAAISTPILRKDFIVSDYQIVEARAHGADCILLIAAACPGNQLRDLHNHAHALGMDVLVEIHDADEAEYALDAGATIVGVNARNLKTLDVNPDTVGNLLPQLPETLVTVAESGVRTVDDVIAYGALGADAVLVGEALVTSKNPAETIHNFTTATVGQTIPTTPGLST